MMFIRGPSNRHFHPISTRGPSLAYWLSNDPFFDDDTLPILKDSVDGKSGSSSHENKNKTKKTEEQPQKRAKLMDSFPVLSMSGFDMQEVNDGNAVLLTTDLPGVKHADLKVEYKDGALHVEAERQRCGTVRQYSRQLPIDEDAVHVPGITATLEDGILTIKVPQKKTTTATSKETEKDAETKGEEQKVIVVSSTSPDSREMLLNMEIDLPGVKQKDLKVVSSKNGRLLSILGSRKRAGEKEPSDFSNDYVLNTREVDAGKLECYLDCGVLTIRAPAKDKLERVIPVNGKMPPVKEQIEEEKDQEKTEKPTERVTKASE